MCKKVTWCGPAKKQTDKQKGLSKDKDNRLPLDLLEISTKGVGHGVGGDLERVLYAETWMCSFRWSSRKGQGPRRLFYELLKAEGNRLGNEKLPGAWSKMPGTFLGFISENTPRYLVSTVKSCPFEWVRMKGKKKKDHFPQVQSNCKSRIKCCKRNLQESYLI